MQCNVIKCSVWELNVNFFYQNHMLDNMILFNRGLCMTNDERVYYIFQVFHYEGVDTDKVIHLE